VTTSTENVIRQTKNWIDEVVIGLSLCPFAAPVVANSSIKYIVCNGDKTEQHLQQLGDIFTGLDNEPDIETSLLIFAKTYKAFDDYLELLHLANLLLEDLGYCGIYQLASFHPDYRFADSAENDASNFSNRSPFPMLHTLRESSVEKAVSGYADIEQLPQINIEKLRQIGSEALQQTLDHIQQENK